MTGLVGAVDPEQERRNEDYWIKKGWAPGYGDPTEVTPEILAVIADARHVTIPVIENQEDLPEAIKWATENSESRWYVAKRAAILGRFDLIAEQINDGNWEESSISGIRLQDGAAADINAHESYDRRFPDANGEIKQVLLADQTVNDDTEADGFLVEDGEYTEVDPDRSTFTDAEREKHERGMDRISRKLLWKDRSDALQDVQHVADEPTAGPVHTGPSATWSEADELEYQRSIAAQKARETKKPMTPEARELLRRKVHRT